MHSRVSRRSDLNPTSGRLDAGRIERLRATSISLEFGKEYAHQLSKL